MMSTTIFNPYVSINFPKSPLILLAGIDLLRVIIFDNRAHHRSSRPDVFSKKGVLENFAKFTGKHLCQYLF